MVLGLYTTSSKAVSKELTMLQWVQRKPTAKGSPGTTCPAALLALGMT